MGVEWIAGTLVLLAIGCVVGAVFLFLGGSWLMQWLRGTAGLLLVGVAGWSVLFAASLFGYEQVPADGPLATVSFEREADQQWTVTVAEANGDRRQYVLAGDLWEMDVRLLRFAGPLSVFGARPSFRLERLAGRYLSLEDQDSKERREYGLLPEAFLGYDVWERARDDSFLLEATRSGVVLAPIGDGAIFEIGMDETGLTLGAGNSVAEAALAAAGG